MSSQPKCLSILFVPLPSPGHIIPMIDIAKILASRGANCTIILTRVPATRFEATITRAKARNHNMHVHVLPFPSTPLLPPNCESTDMLPTRSLSEPFALSLEQMRAGFDEFIRSNLPDAIISDLLMHWTGYVACELGIPRYVFPGTGCFAMSVELAVQMDLVRVDGERVVVSGLPDVVCLTRSKLAEATLPGRNSKRFFERAREADRSTVGMIVNSFTDLEPGYAAHYEKATGKRVWMVGPVSLCNQDPTDVVERGRGTVTSEASKIFDWLDSKPSNSVLYVCFGSLCKFPLAQLEEIGSGLRGSGVPFVWAIRGEGENGGAQRKWIGRFESGLEGRGVVATGWVPQVGILGHPAIGAFLTHCGWGSVTEATSIGVPMLTWPLFAEQFYNEALVTEVVGCGLKMGAERGFTWGEEESVGVVLEAEKIKGRITKIMGNGKEENDVKEKAKMLGEKAREGMNVGGSCYANVGRLMADMRERSGRA